ncbi:MAG: rhodanese-like domain-containing protein [Candidatus Nanopelagicales bacterium]
MVQHASISQLKDAMDAGTARIVDVRERYEFDSGHVPGAVHIPMHTIPLRMDELPTDGDLYLICESGNRSWQVAAFLARHDITAINVEGGTGAWRWSGLPLATGAMA